MSKIEWAVQYTDKMTIYMDGSNRISRMVMSSEEHAKSAVEILTKRTSSEDAEVVFREVGEWQKA